MDPMATKQPTIWAGDHPGAPEQPEYRYALFGCVEKAVWIVSDPKAASCPPAKSTWTCCSTMPSAGTAGQLGAGGGLARMSHRRLPPPRSAHRTPAVDKDRWLSRPAHIVVHMTKLANLGMAL